MLSVRGELVMVAVAVIVVVHLGGHGRGSLGENARITPCEFPP